MNNFKSSGVLKYSSNFKLILEVEKDLIEYYYSLIPKWLNVNKNRYSPHITVVRTQKETPLNTKFWGKYEGQQVEFIYNSMIQYDELYYWLNILSVKLEEIRLELGLKVDNFGNKPPEGFKKYFHCTIGNKKC